MRIDPGLAIDLHQALIHDAARKLGAEEAGEEGLEAQLAEPEPLIGIILMDRVRDNAMPLVASLLAGNRPVSIRRIVLHAEIEGGIFTYQKIREQAQSAADAMKRIRLAGPAAFQTDYRLPRHPGARRQFGGRQSMPQPTLPHASPDPFEVDLVHIQRGENEIWIPVGWACFSHIVCSRKYCQTKSIRLSYYR